QAPAAVTLRNEREREVAHYLVELYLSRVGAGGLEAAAARACAAAAELTGSGVRVRCLSSIFVPADETWFLLYDAASANAVRSAPAGGARPSERVREAVTQR